MAKLFTVTPFVETAVLSRRLQNTGNCSADVLVIVDFIAGIKTACALELRTANADQLFSTYRRSLVSSFGLFTTRLWARHIHDRFRDAVAVRPPPLLHPIP